MESNFPALDGDTVVGVIGLGYVGLPLAIAFTEHFVVYGIDSDTERITALQRGEDRSGTISSASFITENDYLYLYADSESIRYCDVVLVTVPTPITKENNPDLRALKEASTAIGRHIQPGTVVVFESTVYPGVTEDVCAPIIEKESKLRLNVEFFVGYSPERINPGDSQHRLDNVVKLVSGSTPEVTEFVAELYEHIVKAGVYRTPTIKVAEAAKVIENVQRDVNIAVVNEFAQLFHQIGLDSGDILNAAATKWNFLPFRPGLVGGHCIGVDPYYLTYRAKQSGYAAEVILAGRMRNNSIPQHIANRISESLQTRDKLIGKCRVLVMGLTFKEDIPDVRNSKAIEVAEALNELGASVDCFDPLADLSKHDLEESIQHVKKPQEGAYDAIVVAVAHTAFKRLGVEQIRRFGISDEVVIFDVQHAFDRQLITDRL
ncbi:MAG: nucleotide sugar dehydrogenase [Gammaproteobacteria bacterium]|nr:nucleotide sugar dehydrogenase [Gammaproteobacteria bacterium]